ETSPETKRDILAGKTRISRKQLIELASGTEEDAADIVSQIENGTFKSRITRSETTGNELPFDSENNPWSDIPGDTHEMQPWEKAFGKMTDEFRLQMRTLAKNNDTKAVRSALRMYIGMLEDLYKNI
ncbi:MAG: hypothetical protein LBD23_16960, partial [Oscillospiraceae bacterium]|nr:hypothetical protein [Oscillospiraceae bacterium]